MGFGKYGFWRPCIDFIVNFEKDQVYTGIPKAINLWLEIIEEQKLVLQ